MTTEMKNINAYEKGRSAYAKNQTRQPMNDWMFVSSMTEAVTTSDGVPSDVKAYYINEWKRGWDEAKTNNSKPAISKTPEPVKKKAKKKASKKAKK